MRDWEDSVKLQISLKLQLQETNYLHAKGDNHKMAAYDELKERITKSVVQKMLERKKRKNNRNDRGIPQRLKEDEEETIDTLGEEEEIEERKKRKNNRNDRGIPQRLKEDEEDVQELKAPAGPGGAAKRDDDEEDIQEWHAHSKRDDDDDDDNKTLDEWYQKELYQKLINRWTK